MAMQQKNTNLLSQIKIAKLPQLAKHGLWLVLAWLMMVMAFSLLSLLATFYAWSTLLVMLRIGLWGITLITFVLLFWSWLSLCRLCFFSPFLPKLSLQRTLDNNLSIHTPSSVFLDIANQAPVPKWLQMWVMDVVPENSEALGLPAFVQATDLSPHADGQQGVQIGYTLIPSRRGLGVFGGVDLCLMGRFGFWAYYCHLEATGVSRVRVFANFKSVLSGDLLAVAQKSASDGLMKYQRAGQGYDFHQMRPYQQGDAMRQIDWRATSRIHRLMTRQYQEAWSQEILFLLDNSQQMRHQRLTAIHGQVYWVGHLDSVLNAMLLLANVANTQGDATGFISFSGVNDKIAYPKKGTQVMSYLLNQSFDIDTSLKMPDYMLAARLALSVLKKRALIILMTSTRSEGLDDLLNAIELLSAKHLVIFANLYEEDLSQQLAQPTQTLVEACTYHSIYEHLGHQAKLNTRLSTMAYVHPIHCTPSQLPQRLMQSYWLIKQQQR